jgi:hypothetical protein
MAKAKLEPGKLKVRNVSATLHFTVRGPVNTYSSVNFGYVVNGEVMGTAEDAALAKAELDGLVTAFCRDRFPQAIEELKTIVRENEEQI